MGYVYQNNFTKAIKAHLSFRSTLDVEYEPGIQQEINYTLFYTI